MKFTLLIAILVSFLNAAIELTPQEKSYIEEHPTIKVYAENNWAPFNFNEDGKQKGLSIDFIELVAKKSGLKIEYVSGFGWSEMPSKIKDGSLDVVLNIVQNSERDKFLLFTNSYQSVTHCIVTTNDYVGKINSIDDIVTKKIAIEDGFYNHIFLKQNFPNANLLLTKDTVGALKAVSFNQADLTFGVLPAEAYLIKKNSFNNLKLTGIADNNLFSNKELKIATSKNNEILRNIIQKSLDDISQDERNSIVNKWITVDIENKIDWILILKIVGIFIAINLIILFYTLKIRKIQKELAHKNLFMHTLLNSIQSPIFYKDKNGAFLGFNKAYEKAFNIKSADLIGKRVLDLEYLSIEDRKKYHAEDTYIIQTASSTSHEQDMQFADGKIHNTIYAVTGFKDNADEPAGLIGIFTDATELKLTQKELQKVKDEIEILHKHTKSSIEYASLIQFSILPSEAVFKNFFKDYFIIWQPKDIVSGDIYFFDTISSDECLLILVDCTGHGVPGAFVTMLVKAIQNTLISGVKNGLIKPEPSKLLTLFNQHTKHILQQDTKECISSGFDAAIVYFNKKTKSIKYSGAHIALYYFCEGNLSKIKADRQSIGYTTSDINYEFKQHEFTLLDGDAIYLTTDGYIDQNGGENNFPLGNSKFCELLKENHQKDCNLQKEIFINKLNSYKGNEENNDDVTLICLKI